MRLTQPDLPDNTEVVEVAEAARRLGVSVEALRKRIARGAQPGTKRDGRWYAFLVPDTGLTTPDKIVHLSGVSSGLSMSGVGQALSRQDVELIANVILDRLRLTTPDPPDDYVPAPDTARPGFWRRLLGRS